jgi:transcriptional regulator with XRE-family HTH domain
MRREHYQARLLRAVSGKTQEQMAKEIGLQPSHLAQIELGDVMPRRAHLEEMARNESLTLADTAEALDLIETLRRTQQKRALPEEGFAALEEELRHLILRAKRRLAALPAPEPAAEPLHAWVCRRLREEAERTASSNEKAAAVLLRVAGEMAEQREGATL